MKLALVTKAKGSIGRIEVVNEAHVSQLLHDEAVRVISQYADGFPSAIDMEGNPITKWMYHPIHFKLG